MFRQVVVLEPVEMHLPPFRCAECQDGAFIRFHPMRDEKTSARQEAASGRVPWLESSLHEMQSV